MPESRRRHRAQGLAPMSRAGNLDKRSVARTADENVAEPTAYQQDPLFDLPPVGSVGGPDPVNEGGFVEESQSREIEATGSCVPRATEPPSSETESQSHTAISTFDARVGLERSKIEGAARDELGFSAPGVVLTGEQLRWLTFRVDTENDRDADEAAKVDSVKRSMWMKGAEFRAFYETCRDDKREGMRLLGAQMLPTALRVLLDMLNGDNVRAKLGAANLLLRSQGMLVDKVVRADPDQLSVVLAQLREARPPRMVTGPYGDRSNMLSQGASNGESLGFERGLPNHPGYPGSTLGLESDLDDPN